MVLLLGEPDLGMLQGILSQTSHRLNMAPSIYTVSKFWHSDDEFPVKRNDSLSQRFKLSMLVLKVDQKLS
jgi:hypothetical protein